MAAAIAHRGPDDEGIWSSGPIGIGCRRLSIIDVEGGHQPICNETRSIWVVLNGEIYNYRELRERLISQGHSFATDSDTEVIVHLYEERGADCVQELRGMFAFAVWDDQRRQLFLARDRLGQKPLFYASEGDTLLFASEIKAILAVSQSSRQMDLSALHDYLSLRFIPPPRTMLQHVSKLPAAHTLTWTDDRIDIRRYWSLNFRAKDSLSTAECIEQLDAGVERAVASHMISDVPVGFYLSGGLDSSMIVAKAAQHQGRLQTFAVGVDHSPFDERPYARAVAQHCKTEHQEKAVQPELVRLLPRMIWHLDEPSDPIAACMYQAAELASRSVKVVLGGDGGDELFAGFDRYLGVTWVSRYARSLPRSVRRHIVPALLGMVPESFHYKSTHQKARWINQVSLPSRQSQRYAEATCFFRFNHLQKQQLFSPRCWREVGDLHSADWIAREYEAAEADHSLDRMLYADFMTRLPEHTLMLTDRLAMAHGLEVRSPYLDHELVEQTARLPARMKIRHGQLKYVLRRIASQYLPPDIVQRGKQGFMFPVAKWFRDELYPFVRDTLLQSAMVKDGFFNEDYIAVLLEEHRRSRIDHHVRLWMLLNVELWYQLYILDRDVDELSDAICAGWGASEQL